MNERTQTDPHETEVSGDQNLGTRRDDVPSGLTMEERRPEGLSTADIAQGTVESSGPSERPENSATQTPLFASDEAERFRSRCHPGGGGKHGNATCGTRRCARSLRMGF